MGILAPVLRLQSVFGRGGQGEHFVAGLGDLYGPYPGIPARLPTDAATDGASGCEDGCRRGKGKRRKSDSGSEDTLARATLASRRARQVGTSMVSCGEFSLEFPVDILRL